MAKFTEQTLTFWTKPPSTTEETKLGNAERMVREAINSDETLKEKSTEIFGQGSYANNTNVRLDSDIDINVRFTGGFYYGIPDGMNDEDFGLDKLGSTGYSFSKFKDDVEEALVDKFGRKDVKRKDKCITVLANSYRIENDVVPTWNYREYLKSGKYHEGGKFFSESGRHIINYPKKHLENGKNKNASTFRRFKRLTRLHRKIRYTMMDDGYDINGNITSFLLECLVWNVPNSSINNYDTWTERLKQSIIHLYQKTKNKNACKEWGEVSERLYLFHPGRKWSYEDVNEYMVQLWNYLEYK